MSDPVSAKPIAELRSMTRGELIAAHDEFAGLGKSVLTMEDYRAELARRDADAQTRITVRLTWCIAGLTLVSVVLVAYSVLH